MRRPVFRAAALLHLLALAAAGQTTFNSPSGLNLAIPDGSYTGSSGTMACHTITVSSFGSVYDASVQLALTHTRAGDLTIKLTPPLASGSVFTLVSRPGTAEAADNGADVVTPGHAANLSAAFPITFAQSSTVEAEQMGASLSSAGVICGDDGVCTFNPNRGSALGQDESRDAFGGGNGSWTLCIGDSDAGDSGVLDSWRLTLTPVPPADPNAIRPRVLMVVDSSASMHLSTQFFDFGASATFNRFDGVATHGDGSDEQLGCDVNASNGTTFGRPNDSRLFQAKQALQLVLKTRSFRHPSAGFFGEDNLGPPMGLIDFALGTWEKTGGGMSCSGAEGTQSTCPAGLRCWDDNGNGLNRICALRAADVYLECSPFTWDEGTSTFTCNATSCPDNPDPLLSARDQCNYYRVSDTAHGDISPFGSTVVCPTVASDNQFMGYGPTTCTDGGQILTSFPASPTSNFQSVRQWIDHIQPRAANDSFSQPELRAIGSSPVAAALRDMRTYLATGLNGFPAAVATDCSAGCRSYDVVLISDGTDSCESIQNGAAAAAQLLGPFTVATPGCPSPSAQVSVRTHVIAFPGCPEGVNNCAVKTDLDQIAQSGGTSAAVIARSEAELNTAVKAIVDSLLTAVTVNGSTTVCTGSTGGVATAANATQWGFRTMSGGAVTPIQGASVPTYAINASDFPGPGTYFLVAGKCAFGSISAEIPVTVVSSPDATITAPSELQAMTDGAASVPDAGSGATYTWTVSGAAFTGQGTRSIVFDAPSSGQVTLNASVQGQLGCSATDSHIVNITSGSTFTDDPLMAGLTVVKAVHLVELRVAVNARRARAALPDATWAEPIGAGTVIKAAHITELRSALTPALTAAPSFTDATLSSGMPIRAVHVQEIREYSR